MKMTRRDFIRAGAAAGGGLLISFVLPARAGPEARREPPPEAAVGQATARLSESTPGWSSFIRIDRAGKVHFIVHKVEMGQGTFTALPMLLAEELDVDLRQVTLEQAPADNDRYADPLLGGQVTGGSTSVRSSWEPLRLAGATARAMLVTAAAQRWDVEAAECETRDGRVIHPSSGRSAGYGELVDEAARLPVPAEVALKPPGEFRLIGKPVRRLDSAAKVDGSARFGIDVERPGMRIATVAASPVRGGRLAGSDDAKALAVAGVSEVLKLDDAIAVVGVHMWAALQGLAAAAPRWDDGANAKLDTAAIVAEMEAASAKPGAVARSDGDALAEIDRAPRTLEAVYQMPFLAHATMEPMNCTVELSDDACDLWIGTQVPALAQAAAAKIAGLPQEKVRVHNHYLGGGFGRRLEVDMVVQAVALAKQTKGPLKLVWSREEDIRHDLYRPYYYDRIAAAIGTDGMPTAWFHRVTGSSIFSRFAPGMIKDGVDPDAVEGARDAPYAFPAMRVEYVRHEPPLPTAFWRGVGPTHNVWVVESFVDELAVEAGRDAVAYRLALLAHQPRLKTVLQLAADKAGWGRPSAPPAGHKRGQGVSAQFVFGSYMAQVADVSVSPEGEVRVHRVVCAVDCGQVVNPDVVAAQIESGVVFGLTAALWGEITVANGRVQQGNFNDYRMMRIDEAPRIEVHIVPSSDPPGGIGEPGTAAVGPALTNAIFAATGRRLRKLPVADQLKT